MIPNRMVAGESLISSPENPELVLTTHRLRSLQKALFRQDFVSIFLEDIASISVKVRTNWLVLGLVGLLGSLSGIAFIFGGFQHRQDNMIWTGLAAIGCGWLFGYLMAQKYVISVQSKGGDMIELQAKSSDSAQIITFVESVEAAKAERVRSLGLRP